MNTCTADVWKKDISTIVQLYNRLDKKNCPSYNKTFVQRAFEKRIVEQPQSAQNGHQYNQTFKTMFTIGHYPLWQVHECTNVRFQLPIAQMSGCTIVWLHMCPLYKWLLYTWWRHQMEALSASTVHGEFPTQMPVTRSFDVFFDLRLNNRLSKQSRGWWFETPSRPLWRHCNAIVCCRCVRCTGVRAPLWSTH